MSKLAHILPPKFFSELRTKYRACYNPIFIRTVLLRSVLVVLPTVLYGCIILPLHNPDPLPFSADKNDLAILGYTTKDRVVERWGKPSTSRLSERIYIYARGQKDWIWFGGVLLPMGFQLFGVASTIPTYKTHFLIFEFDKNDVVTAIHTFNGDPGELESGFYVVSSGVYTVNKFDPKLGAEQGLGVGVGLFADRKWYFSPRDFILRAPVNIDKQAKTYDVPPNKAVIYYYKEFSDNVEVALDDNLSGDPGIDGFLMWVVDPGDHTVNCPFRMGRLSIECYPGEKYYLEHKNENGKIRVEDKLIGKEAILKRKLVVERLNDFDFD